MNLFYTPVLLVSITTTIACSTGKQAAVPYANWYPGFSAWNEDTVLKYQFTISRNHRFTYVTNDKDSSGHITTTIYEGKFRNSHDTLYLDFDKKTPAPLTPYLVKEVSGKYLIQYFTNGRKRMFLHFIPLTRYMF